MAALLYVLGGISILPGALLCVFGFMAPTDMTAVITGAGLIGSGILLAGFGRVIEMLEQIVAELRRQRTERESRTQSAG